VKDVIINGFLEISINPWFALNVKVLIGIEKGGENEKAYC